MLGLWIVCAPAISAGKTSKSIQDGYSPEAASWRSHGNAYFRSVLSFLVLHAFVWVIRGL